jgi:LPS sulfotransferase NodH/transposase-like protein
VRKALIIASEVRSGSTFIGESVAYHLSKIFGDVLFDLTREHFADLNERSSHSEILTKFNSLYLGHQGWVASKIMCAALSVIVREARKAEAVRLAFFGPDTHWIIVRRRLKIRQAISLAHAIKTGDWHVYTTEGTTANKSIVGFRDIEDALRAILLSDTFLETFSGLIPGDNKVEVFYEDFLSDPSMLIEHVYNVFGISLPSGGLQFTDETKIRQSTMGLKRDAEKGFGDWFLQNYYKVEAMKAVTVAPAQSKTANVASIFQLSIVSEFIKEGKSIKSLAKQHGIDRSLISYWIAKHRHGELGEQSVQADALTYYKNRVYMLEREVDQLKRLGSNSGTSAEHDYEVSGRAPIDFDGA